MRYTIILLMGLVLFGLGCVSQQNQTNTGNGGTAPFSNVTVELKNIQFNPSSITLAAGGTIHFVNRDGFAHDVHVKKNGADIFPKTQVDAQGSVDVTLNEKGTYELLCDRHAGANMNGTITVK